MDNLRLEHPNPFSTHAQAGTHHLLSFAPPSIELTPQLNKPTNVHPHANPFSSSWASLWAEPPFPQNPNALLKHGMQSPDRHVAVESPLDGPPRPWDVSADPILHPRHWHSINISTEFPHAVGATSMEVLQGDSPTLQLKHSSSLLAHEFGHLAVHPDSGRGGNFLICGSTNGLSEGNTSATHDFQKGSSHLPGLPVDIDKGSTSPVSVVSGPQPDSFTRKVDCTAGQNQRFMSFPWHNKDESDRAALKGKDDAIMVKAEVMGESSPTHAKSFRGEYPQQVSGGVEKGVIVKKEQEGGVTIASLEDGSIGLKLGKRTYYGEVSGEDASRRANNSSTYNGAGKSNGKNSSNVSCATTAVNVTAATTPAAANTTTTTSNNIRSSAGGGTANKKHKGSSASAVVPACQAEGCTADLSGAKDYHRRHKVCEWHSKASKAKVNNLEQRFCQQCSRFHVLSAFDEGKRSCRRRLAGHNERRRKPPPEPMPFLSPGGFAYFADGRVNSALHDHPFFLQHRRNPLVPASVDTAVLACQLGLAGFPQQGTMGNYHALELHHFMQGAHGVGVLDGGGALMLANGNALALSNASSLPTPASSSTVGLLPHVSSEMAISGRALSLLSPSLGSPETMSISLGMTSPTIDQFPSDTHALASSSRQQVAPSSTPCFSSGISISSALHGLSQSHNHALNSLTSSSSGCSTDIDPAEQPPMSNFEGRSLFLMHSESGFQNLQESGNTSHGRPMLDLMQISPAESRHHHHHQQSQAELSFADLQGLSIFNKQSMM